MKIFELVDLLIPLQDYVLINQLLSTLQELLTTEDAKRKQEIVKFLRRYIPLIPKDEATRNLKAQGMSIEHWLNHLLLALTYVTPLNEKSEENELTYTCPISLVDIDVKSDVALTNGYLYNRAELVKWYSSREYKDLNGAKLSEFDISIIKEAQAQARAEAQAAQAQTQGVQLNGEFIAQPPAPQQFHPFAAIHQNVSMVRRPILYPSQVFLSQQMLDSAFPVFMEQQKKRDEELRAQNEAREIELLRQRELVNELGRLALEQLKEQERLRQEEERLRLMQLLQERHQEVSLQVKILQEYKEQQKKDKEAEKKFWAVAERHRQHNMERDRKDTADPKEQSAVNPSSFFGRIKKVFMPEKSGQSYTRQP